jgi:hypothetical protein
MGAVTKVFGPVRMSGYDHPSGGQFEFPFEIAIGVHNNTFTVKYGKEVQAGLSYTKAATELGAAIMHALCCEGMLPNEGVKL